MKINYSPRQSGKTTKMIERLAQDERFVLLTFSMKEADRLREAYYGYVDPKRIMYWREYLNRKQGKGYGQKVLIDNADMVLEDVIGDYIEEISMTSPKNPLEILRNKY